jgi:adenosine kinase
VHILNVSFLVPTLRREFGGCAGNIAYTLQALGGDPVMAALGNDGGEYLARLQGWGSTPRWCCASRHLHRAGDHHHRQDNNQITAFHPGAMQSGAQHRRCRARTRRPEAIAIIAPDGREAMSKRAEAAQ